MFRRYGLGKTDYSGLLTAAGGLVPGGGAAGSAISASAASSATTAALNVLLDRKEAAIDELLATANRTGLEVETGVRWGRYIAGGVALGLAYFLVRRASRRA